MPGLRTRDRSDESFTLPSPGERRAQRLCPGQSRTACCHQALSPGRCGAAVSRSGAFFSPAPSAFLRGDNWVLPRRSPVLKYAGAANEPSRVRTQPQRFTGPALWRGVSPISRANKSCLRGDGPGLRQSITAGNPSGRRAQAVAFECDRSPHTLAEGSIRATGRPEAVDLSVLLRQVADPAAEMPRCNRHPPAATATSVTVHSPGAGTAVACDVISGRNALGAVTSKLGNGVQGPPVGAIPTLMRAGSISPRGCTGGVLSMATTWRSLIATPDDTGLMPGNRCAATSLSGDVAPAGAGEPPRRR
jgi:hypothetical protein